LFFVAQLLDDYIITHSVLTCKRFVCFCVIIFRQHRKGVDMTTFDRIKTIAKSRGMNLKQVAKASGMSENAIYRYNQGVEPTGPSLKAIADTLLVTVDYLTGETEINNYTGEKSAVKQADIEDDDLMLAFDGMEIDEEDKQAIIELLKFRRFQKGNNKN
jgi:transcriptional regulator with XRE-family HTH domain